MCSIMRIDWCSVFSTNGILDGLRIDHVDGLLNPKEYLQTIA